ncbi:MAG: Asp23/Gls24 family envelope stress response protein [Moorellales bacterium]
MRVLALVGPSGSGKSHHAQLVAHEYGAEAIIDDGLLIAGSSIVGGTSAKRQPTRVGAIRTALFSDPQHAGSVKAKIRELAPSALLILATSGEMARRIARNLDLPEPEQVLDIFEVASPEAIARAKRARQFGRHVIPAPTVEVKPRLSGTVIEPIRAILRRPASAPQETTPVLWVDQSVVRPTFTYLGRFYVANEALVAIATHSAALLGHRLEKVEVVNRPEGVIINAELELPYGIRLPEAARRTQQQIVRVVEHMTALNVLEVNLTVRRLVFSNQDPPATGVGGDERKSWPADEGPP